MKFLGHVFLISELSKQVRGGWVKSDFANKGVVNNLLTSHRNSTVLWVHVYHLTLFSRMSCYVTWSVAL